MFEVGRRGAGSESGTYDSVVSWIVWEAILGAQKEVDREGAVESVSELVSSSSGDTCFTPCEEYSKP